MTRSDDRNAWLDQQAEAREEAEMDAWYEQQGKEHDEQMEYWEKCYREEVITTMQDEFNKKIQCALEYTADTCGWIRGGTRVLDSDDDMIFIKRCLVNLTNFDIDFNGPEIEFYNVVMSGSDIISMNDIATTNNMMIFMEKYFEDLDDKCYDFIKDVSLRKDAFYNKQMGSEYIMVRYVPKWKLTAEKDEERRDEDLWEQHCDREREIERLWDLQDYKEEEIRQEQIRLGQIEDVCKI